MPWYALPFADRARKNKLSQKFKVEGIPSFVILDKNGELMTDKGRAAFMKDPKGENLPWKPESVIDMLKRGNFLGPHNTKISFEEMSRDCDILGLYFSASWCPPCHRFTPVLAECYKKLQENDQAAGRPQRFKIVFLTADRSEKDFKGYFEHMPWYALSYDNAELKELIEERYEVEGIPTLVILDAKTGVSVNTEGVQAVMSDPGGENYPWKPQSVELLDPSTASKIGPNPSVFVFCDSKAKAKEMQKDLATAVDVWQGNIEEGAVCHGDVCVPTGGKLEGTADMLFFVCDDHPLSERIKELAKAPSRVPVVILDLSGPTYAHGDFASLDKVNPLSLRRFIKSYLEGNVPKLALDPPK